MLKTGQAFSSFFYAFSMVLPYQVAQIFGDIVDHGHYLPPLTEDEIINAGMLAMKYVLIGHRDSANAPRLFQGRWR